MRNEKIIDALKVINSKMGDLAGKVAGMVEDGTLKAGAVLRKNKTFAEQVVDENTIYEIRYPFDLGGNSVTIPSGCVLKFNGGRISNGTLVGQNTAIEYNAPIFTGISISGTWNVPEIHSWMMTDIADDKLFDLCCSVLTSK